MYKAKEGRLTKREKSHIGGITNLPVTSIDETIQDLLLGLNEFADARDLCLKAFGSFGGMTFDVSRINRWQTALRQLEQMEDEEPQKKKYNHLFIRHMAAVFNINYELPASYANLFPT